MPMRHAFELRRPDAHGRTSCKWFLTDGCNEELGIGHDLFLTNSFKFTIHLSFYHRPEILSASLTNEQKGDMAGCDVKCFPGLICACL